MPLDEHLRSALSRISGAPARWPWAVIAVSAYVFFAPNFDFAFALAWHDGQRLAQLGLFGALLLTLAVPGTAAGAAAVWAGLPRAACLSLAAAFALGLASSLYAEMPRWALLEWGTQLLLLFTAMMVAANRRMMGARADGALVAIFFATASAYAVTTCSVYGAMLLIGPEYGQGFNIRELYTGFSNVRFFGHIQTMLLPFLLLPAMWWGTTRLRRMLLWSAPAIWWMLAIGSGTRGTWAALLAGTIAALLFAGNAGRRWAKWQVAGLLCGFCCYAVFVLGLPQLQDLPVTFMHRTDDILTLSRRGELWSTALDYVTRYPVFGVGPMHYAYWATEVAAHPHNAVLQWLAEWGIPAALLFTGVCAMGGLALALHVRRVAGQVDDRASVFQAALLAALTGAAAQAMVDGILVMPVSQMVLVLLVGWAIGVVSLAKGQRVIGRWEGVVLTLAILIATTAVVYGVAPEIGQLAERQEAYLAARNPGERLLPRFWAQGWINR